MAITIIILLGLALFCIGIVLYLNNGFDYPAINTYIRNDMNTVTRRTHIPDNIKYMDNGCEINQENFDLYVSTGNTQKGSVHKNDIVLLPKDFNNTIPLNNDELPALYAFRYNNHTNGANVQVVCKVWKEIQINYQASTKEIKQILEDVGMYVISHPSYQHIRNLSYYPGDNKIMKRFLNDNIDSYVNYIKKQNYKNIQDYTLCISTFVDEDPRNNMYLNIQVKSRCIGKLNYAFQLP